MTAGSQTGNPAPPDRKGRRVVHFATVHPPTDIRVFHRECRALADAGYDVAYVGPADGDSVVNGVRICGVAKPRGRVDRAFLCTWRVFRRALRENAQVYHFHDPELLPAGLIFKLIFGKRVIYDAHEDTPRSVYNKYYLPKATRFAAAWACEFLEILGMLAFDNLIAATPAIARRFPKRKAVVVQNFPIMEEVRHDHPTPMAARPPNVIYMGELSRQRGLCEMVDAMALVPPELNCRLVMAGKFVFAELEAELRAKPGWKFVDFLGWRSRQEILEQLGQARAGLVLFHAIPNHTEAQPAKLFEYMAAGLPLIASNFEHWRTFVEAEKCGIQCDPRNPQSVADAITRIVSDPATGEAMGKRGQTAVRERFNWGIERQSMLNMYDRLFE